MIRVGTTFLLGKMASTFLSTLSTLLLVVAAEAQAQTYSVSILELGRMCK